MNVCRMMMMALGLIQCVLCIPYHAIKACGVVHFAFIEEKKLSHFIVIIRTCFYDDDDNDDHDLGNAFSEKQLGNVHIPHNFSL